MAIQTQGHRVSVMPGFTPVDPSLVAFNPQAITSGALTAIQIAQQLQRKRAFDIQQAELAATRDARIAEELARSGIVTQTAPGVIGATNARNLSTVQIQPSATDLAIAGNQAGLGDIQFREQMRPLTQDTLRMGIEAKNANAPYETDLLFGQTDRGLQDVRLANELAPLTNQLAVAQTTQKLDELPEDKALNDRLKRAEANLKEAQAEAAKAQADYTKRDRPKAGQDATDQLQKQLGHVEQSIQRLENSKVINPSVDNNGMPVPLVQYQGQTRGPDGKVLTDQSSFLGIPFGSATPKKLNPVAEQKSAELARLYALRDELNGRLTAGVAQDAGVSLTQVVAPAPAAPPATSTDRPLTPAEAAKLPPGTPFIGTDGKRRVRN
jgi:hypothetical protein